jgi:hypothetical protein
MEQEEQEITNSYSRTKFESVILKNDRVSAVQRLLDNHHKLERQSIIVNQEDENNNDEEKQKP